MIHDVHYKFRSGDSNIGRAGEKNSNFGYLRSRARGRIPRFLSPEPKRRGSEVQRIWAEREPSGGGERLSAVRSELRNCPP